MTVGARSITNAARDTYLSEKNKKSRFDVTRNGSSGGGEIRTPGTFQYDGFQDRSIKPLWHSSLLNQLLPNEGAKIGPFFYLQIVFEKFAKNFCPTLLTDAFKNGVMPLKVPAGLFYWRDIAFSCASTSNCKPRSGNWINVNSASETGMSM